MKAAADELALTSRFTREIEVLIDLAQALGDRDFVRYLQQHF
jgi:hypothetical protein